MAVGSRKTIMEQHLADLRKKTEESHRRQALWQNREKVKEVVISALGWKSLEPFAEDMLNKALAGEFVDVPALIANLKKWQQEELQKGGVKNGIDEVQ